MDSCFGLNGSRQHGVAVKSKATRWLSYRLLNAPTSFPGSSLFLPRESTLVAAGHVSLGNEFKSHTKRVTQDNRKNPEYHVVVAITRMRTDKTCSAENTWLNHLKNKQHIESKKELRPTKAQNTMNGLHKDSVDSKHQLTQRIYSTTDCKSFSTYIADRTRFSLPKSQKSHETKSLFRQFSDVTQQTEAEGNSGMV